MNQHLRGQNSSDLKFVRNSYPNFDKENKTILMDADKGQLSAFQKTLTYVRKFICARHRANRIHGKFGVEAKKLYWDAVYATTSASLINTLTELRRKCQKKDDEKQNNDDENYFLELPLEEQFIFSAVHRNPPRRVLMFNRCTSQLAESLNQASKDSRAQHFLHAILTLLHDELQRLQNQRTEMEKRKADESSLVPVSKNSIDEIARQAAESSCSITTWRGGRVDVKMGAKLERVNLQNMSCTCGTPDIHGEPCLHVYHAELLTFMVSPVCTSTWQEFETGTRTSNVSIIATACSVRGGSNCTTPKIWRSPRFMSSKT